MRCPAAASSLFTSSPGVLSQIFVTARAPCWPRYQRYAGRHRCARRCNGSDAVACGAALAATALGARLAVVDLAGVAGTGSGHVGFWPMQPIMAASSSTTAGHVAAGSDFFSAPYSTCPPPTGPGAPPRTPCIAARARHCAGRRPPYSFRLFLAPGWRPCQQDRAIDR